MRDRRLLTCLLLGALAGCAPRRPADPPPAERAYDNPALGVSFMVPEAWVDDVEGAAVVVGGPAGTPAYFTPLTVQASPVAAGGLDLGHVLAASWDHIPSDEPPLFVTRAPALAGGLPGVRYLVAFDLHERARLRAGLMFQHGASVVDVGCVAPRELFVDALPVFERALDTLTLAPPDGGEP